MLIISNIGLYDAAVSGSVFGQCRQCGRANSADNATSYQCVDSVYIAESGDSWDSADSVNVSIVWTRRTVWIVSIVSTERRGSRHWKLLLLSIVFG